MGTAQALYEVVVTRYSSPATAALGRLLLPYLFPELSAFATVEDLVSHLRTSDARYRATIPAEFLERNQPPMFITLYFIVTRLPDSLRSVRDHFLSLDPTSLTVDLLEQHLLAAETSAVAIGDAHGTPHPPFFEGCSPSPLAPSYASTTATDVSVAEGVGAASASEKHCSSKGKGGTGGGSGSGGGGGDSGSGGGGGSGGIGGIGGGGGGGTSGGSGGSGGGGGGSGGSGGRGSSGTRGSRIGPGHGGPGGGQRQQQQRRSETQSPQQLRKLHTQHHCFSRLDNAWRAEFGDDVELPRWADILRSRIAIFDLDFDAILSAMYALSVSAEGDCSWCVPPNPACVDLHVHTDGASPGYVHSSARVESVHSGYRSSSGSCVCSGVRVRSGSYLLLVWPPIAPDSYVEPPPGSPLPAMPLWHALPFSHLWSTQVSASPPALACPDLPSLRRGAAARHSSLLVSLDVSSIADSPHGRSVSSSASGLTRTFLSCVCTLTKVRHIGEVARTSMIYVAAPHFLWPFTVRYATHLLILSPCVSLLETSPILRWKGEVGDASLFRVWGSHAFVRDTSADKLFARAIPCVFSGFLPDVPGWQFYHPTSRRVLPSQDVTFDELVPFHCLFPYRSAPPQPPPLFLAPDPLPSTVLVNVAVGSGAARGAASGGAASWGAEPGGEGSEGAGSGGAERGAAKPEGVEPGGAESEGAESGGAEPRGAASFGGHAGASLRLSPHQLREWLARRAQLQCGAPGAGGAGDTAFGGAGVLAGAEGTRGTAATGPEGARTSGAEAAGTGGVGGAGAGDPMEPGAAGAGGSCAGGSGAGGARVGGTGEGGAGVVGARAVDPGVGDAGGTVRPRPYFVDKVPPPGANIVDGMCIFRRDYELHSLDFSTAFLQGSLHEKIWLRHPPGFTGSFPAGTQWSLRRPVYGLRQVPRKWHDTLRTTLAALGFAPSTTDPSLFLCTDTSLPLFYVLVYVDDLVFATADIEALTLVQLCSYLGLQITQDRARYTITLTQSHMVHQVLQRFSFQFSSPQPTPLSTGHSLSAPP
ncbi:unnamed protein product [Closterium sp. NIES-53]